MQSIIHYFFPPFQFNYCHYLYRLSIQLLSNIFYKRNRIILLMHFTLTVILLLSSTCLSSNNLLIHTQLQCVQHHFSNVKMSNYTGSGVGTQMEIKFASVIQAAYVAYGNQSASSTAYIQKELQKQYGQNFGVVILKQNQTTSFSLYVTKSVIIVWTKVNKFEPSWAYIIWQISTQDTSDFSNSFQAGPGLTFNMDQNIRSLIQVREYNNLKAELGKPLQTQYGGKWNILCKGYTSLFMQARFLNTAHSYIHVPSLGYKCEYLIFVLFF